MPLHLLKICVGVDEVAELVAWQKQRLVDLKRQGLPAELRHLTHQLPKRAAEIVAGGSLYWIIKGFVRVRQRIRRIDLLEPPERGKHCALVLDRRLVPTELQPRRPHQGWRYLDAKDAPADLDQGRRRTGLPPALLAELRQLGLL
ncbi:MAG: DUF1489 family protein [Alphaproteobacteria bacterium]|nr:DUF1489 family protein [Alphaproteobacteria bacterium]